MRAKCGLVRWNTGENRFEIYHIEKADEAAKASYSCGKFLSGVVG